MNLVNKMPECSVCMVDMDMEEYDDPNESTRTCVRLDCKHAYHTKCVLKYMKETNYECILCNKHRNPIEEAGLIEQAHAEVRNDKEFRRLKKEVRAAASEFTQTKKIMKQAIQEFIRSHADEWQANEKRKKVLSLESKLIRYVRKFVLAKPMLAGAVLPKLNMWSRNSISGLRMWQYRSKYVHFDLL